VHIPDGYLSPFFSVGSGVVTVPAWSVAAMRLQRTLRGRSVPLLALMSALSFALMMVSFPVPGGTTAHAVGGTLMAIVLGPWAAVVGVSVALVIQALFFGDGGVLAIPINCLNLGVILPLVGYAAYRLIAAGASPRSTRRLWAAGVAGYLGLTVAAIAVGIELGVQPLLFRSGGMPLYSPYGLAQTVPVMILSHGLGASFVEAAVTVLGLSYLQRLYPGLLPRRARPRSPSAAVSED
jgi:cobalt/nickel transport system permease protein